MEEESKGRQQSQQPRRILGHRRPRAAPAQVNYEARRGSQLIRRPNLLRQQLRQNNYSNAQYARQDLVQQPAFQHPPRLNNEPSRSNRDIGALPTIPEHENEQINSQNASGGEGEFRPERTRYYQQLISETLDLNQFVGRNQINQRLFTESSQSEEVNLYEAISEQVRLEESSHSSDEESSSSSSSSSSQSSFFQPPQIENRFVWSNAQENPLQSRLSFVNPFMRNRPIITSATDRLFNTERQAQQNRPQNLQRSQSRFDLYRPRPASAMGIRRGSQIRRNPWSDALTPRQRQLMIDGYFDPDVRSPTRQAGNRLGNLRSVLISDMADSISLSSNVEESSFERFHRQVRNRNASLFGQYLAGTSNPRQQNQQSLRNPDLINPSQILQRPNRRNSEVDINSDNGIEQDSDYTEMNEYLNACSDDEDDSDSIDGFVNIRPGSAAQNSSDERYYKKILQEVHQLYGNLTCLFISRAIKPHSLIQLKDFQEPPLSTVEDATKKIFHDLFSRLKYSLDAIEKEQFSLKKIGSQAMNYSLLNKVQQIMPTNSQLDITLTKLLKKQNNQQYVARDIMTMKIMVDLKIKFELARIGQNRVSHCLLKELLPLALRINKEGFKNEEIFKFIAKEFLNEEEPWSTTQDLVYFDSSYDNCAQHYQNLLEQYTQQSKEEQQLVTIL